MPQRFRLAAVYLALAAMVLRALMPVGWMPNPGGAVGSFLTICTMDGPIQLADQHNHGKNSPDSGQHSHDECPFAAAPHVAAPAIVAHIALPSYFRRFSNPSSAATAAAQLAVYHSQSPRAPPLAA